MAGTKAGGMKAAATNKAKYGKEFYARIGKKGGQNGHTGGFAANPELARLAGAKGGKKSKRGKAKRNAEGHALKTNGEEYARGEKRISAVPKPKIHHINTTLTEEEKKEQRRKIFRGFFKRVK